MSVTGLRRYADVGNRLAAADDGPAADQGFLAERAVHLLFEIESNGGSATNASPTSWSFENRLRRPESVSSA